MSSLNQRSGVDVNVQQNPRLLNLAGGTRITAIVGMGPTSRTLIDEAVVRGSGSIDYLSLYPGANIVATQFAEIPNVVSGLVNAVARSNGGALYAAASASVGANGAITWSGSGDNVPTQGSIYYVTYTGDVPSTQFTPTVTSDKQFLIGKYGEESNTTGILTIAGSINLENGAPGVMIVQASGSVYSDAAYRTAIDKLLTKTNVEELVVVFPSGSVTRAQQELLFNYAYNHIMRCNTLGRGKERGLITGSPSAYFTSGGFDTIGDDDTAGTYVYRANNLNYKQIQYITPSNVWRTDKNGVIVRLDGNFAAAAIAGLKCAQPLKVTPLENYVVTGIQIEDEKWTDFEMKQLQEGGCTVLESRDSVVRIHDYNTTDNTSVDTEEPSIVTQERKLRYTLSLGLAAEYTGKGKVVTPSTPADIVASTRTILSQLVKAGELYEYGTEDNPVTGETKIFAQQNATEPRQIDVTCSCKYLYPLKFISITVSTYI